MEEVRPTIWMKKPFAKLLFVVLLFAACWGGYRAYKDMTMPPPLVFLIPAEYFGPVFFFFGQPDGVEMQSDPLGQAVTIPSNGVLKIRAQVNDVMGQSREGYRATWMISVASDGEQIGRASCRERVLMPV